MINKQVSWWPGNVDGRRHPRPSPGLGHLRDDDLRLRRRRPSAGLAVVGDRHRLLRDRHGPGAGRVRALGRAQGRLLGEGGPQVDRRDDPRRLRWRGSLLVGFSAWVDARRQVENAVFAVVGAFGLVGIVRRARQRGEGEALVGARLADRSGRSASSAHSGSAKPHSLWARLFYSDERKRRARERFASRSATAAAAADAGPSPPPLGRRPSPARLGVRSSSGSRGQSSSKISTPSAAAVGIASSAPRMPASWPRRGPRSPRPPGGSGPRSCRRSAGSRGPGAAGRRGTAPARSSSAPGKPCSAATTATKQPADREPDQRHEVEEPDEDRERDREVDPEQLEREPGEDARERPRGTG